ncbi:3'(2'),5'-bisphosphate nucleotidase CysQ [Robertkochia marina]|uniref:3'(2'),5'-bisphosphate nucleotidase CysQ n=1 Tax=Robertkochia marina TaxID=1227945 RepID=A0A4S3M2I1_9FLAO|nr:3'(2'),5'-bisphosphate nucleotidase CysQ [Robertkochia marina]THD69334.1 3'(2'),5'-bisphosphate nucleotidase CysQ [Robertkochia marina]TRZ47405.1 3'(2'),5'-bisphosphate nucleotidase [Robertkochia marina]
MKWLDGAFSNHVKTALKAAVEAGKVIMEVYGGQLETELKADDSPVTLADRRAHDIISKTLQTTGIPVISEEMNLPDHEIRKKWQRYWLVDPLDGTKEFIDKGVDFTVNIALMEEHQPVLGILLLPCSKEIYLGDKLQQKGWKTTLDRLEWADLHETSWQSLPKLTPVEDCTIVASRSHLKGETLEFIEQIKEHSEGQEVRLLYRGSAVKFCMIAEGKAQVYPRFAPCMEWDTAAGQALCEALGAIMVRMEDRRPLDYSKPLLLNPPFLLTAPGKQHF